MGNMGRGVVGRGNRGISRKRKTHWLNKFPRPRQGQQEQWGDREKCMTLARIGPRTRSKVGRLSDALGRLRLLTAHTQGIIFELDSQVRLIRVWTSDPRLLARPEHELLGKTILEALGPAMGERHHLAALRTVATGVAESYSYELEVPSGLRQFSCESTAVPAARGGGNHALFWIRDITEQVLIQKRLTETKRLASLATLAAGVAHEINNPLAYMLLNSEHLNLALAELASEPRLTERLEPLLTRTKMMHEGTLRVRRIVTELLQLSRPDTQLVGVNVPASVQEAVEIIRSEEGERPKVVVAMQHTGPILAHMGRLVLVFTNLLKNAMEATKGSCAPGGDCSELSPVEVNVRQTESNVEVSVRDGGRGISPETRSSIFDPFFTTKQEGIGLGLAICQRIVESFHGEIQVVPNTPSGSVFRVILPLHNGDNAPSLAKE